MRALPIIWKRTRILHQEKVDHRCRPFLFVEWRLCKNVERLEARVVLVQRVGFLLRFSLTARQGAVRVRVQLIGHL